MNKIIEALGPKQFDCEYMELYAGNECGKPLLSVGVGQARLFKANVTTQKSMECYCNNYPRQKKRLSRCI